MVNIPEAHPQCQRTRGASEFCPLFFLSAIWLELPHVALCSHVTRSQTPGWVAVPSFLVNRTLWDLRSYVVFGGVKNIFPLWHSVCAQRGILLQREVQF